MNTSDADLDILDCGRSIEQLSAYLDAGRAPRDPDIEGCPECLNALEALARVGDLSRDLLNADAAALPEPSGTWFAGIMDVVAAELRSGRDLPLHHPDPRVRITVAEGAVRALLRATGDEIPGLYIGRTRLVGDADVPGEPVDVDVTASVAWNADAVAIADMLRGRIAEILRRHTELNVAAIDVTIEDVHGWDRREEAP